MPLKPGTRLGPYEIESSLGAGGMGEVYRARDTRLDRAVAIKVLPVHLADSAERRARFEREARTISSLNHPHIGQLYDVGRENGVDYLVLELLEGETLAHRLEKGPVPPAQVIQYGIQIADALDRAHKSGIVHRDLKPGNIMITRGGVKLLDFGLARAVEAVAGPQAITLSPAAGQPLTAEGTILGTFQYMAPEQLEGKDADHRTDLFALGEILYEMATGKRAFEGKSQASLIAAILEREPASMSGLAPLTPPALERVVRACLAKDPDERLQTAHDVKLELQWIAEGGSSVGVPAVVAARRKERERLAWGLAAVTAAVAIGALAMLLLHHTPPPRLVRFEIFRPKMASAITWPRLSPDGAWVAFQSIDTSGQISIWVRPLDALEPRPLAGTEGAGRPFWSPDSRFVAFFAGRKLKKTPVDGGPTQLVADASGADGSWGSRGIILYDNGPTDSVMQVPAAGGIPKPASTIDRKAGEMGTAWPQFLPDGRHFLYVGNATSSEQTRLRVGEVGDFKSWIVRATASRGEYAAPGRLVYVLDNNLVSQPFDLGSFRLSGEPTPIAEKVNLLGGRENFSTSQTGTIAFQSGVDQPASELVWIDRGGRKLGLVADKDLYGDLNFSPDRKQVAVDVADMSGGKSQIWIVDVSRGTKTRFSFGNSNFLWPVWSPDGQWIAYADDASGSYQVMRRRADGEGEARPVGEHIPTNNGPVSWSPDGRYLLTQGFDSNWNVDVIDLAPGGKRTPLLHTPANEYGPHFSPDGRWITYESDESGRREVYVTAFPGARGKWQVSLHGGRSPLWTPDGKDIQFVAPDGRWMNVPVETTPTFRAGDPEVLFQVNLAPSAFSEDRVLPMPDGRRFLVNEAVSTGDPAPITVVLNWMSAISK
jgi:Tol biopolymer transport system component